jgi:hypothetical protein
MPVSLRHDERHCLPQDHFDDVEPKVMRRVEVPLSIRLDRLHAVLQAALGWTNSHLWELRAGGTGWGIPDRNWGDGPNDAAKARLIDVLDDTGAKRLTYLYDFGDGWEHTIRIERVAAALPGASYPRLIEASGRCPPEDIGGPPGYEEFLAAIRNPGDERHAEITEWHDADFDPNVLDVDIIERELAALAKRWSHPTRKRKTA